MSTNLQWLDPMLLKANSWNPNKVDPINFEKLKNSLQKEGFCPARPVITRLVNDTHEIIGGEHRTAAAIELGIERIPVLCLGEIPEDQAKRLVLIDNMRYGEDDSSKLSELINSGIGSVDELLDILPIDESELNGYFEHDTLDDLDEFDDLDDLDDPIDLSTDLPTQKDSQIIRFKLSLEDADRIQTLITKTQSEQGFSEGDKLQNSGDALVHLLLSNADD